MAEASTAAAEISAAARKWRSLQPAVEQWFAVPELIRNVELRCVRDETAQSALMGLDAMLRAVREPAPGRRGLEGVLGRALDQVPPELLDALDERDKLASERDAAQAELRLARETIDRLRVHVVRELLAARLSEGHAARLLGLDRIEVRRLADECAEADRGRGGE